ncbi:MAG: transglutaminase-like domain-containing protein [Clostridia bacterium]|nr:transglutaminase-like domain-containing protein [Clostridia bacterium]
MNALEYFAAPGLMTSTGSHAALFERLPSEIGSLCRVVQGLMLHVFWLERYGAQLPKSRLDEVQLRSVVTKLARMGELDPRPLTEARTLDKRLVGNCRDFSLMLTAMLRYQGIPARARCGFARYFLADHYEDHWVCEYWNAALLRWVLVDPQLDDLQCNVLAVEFDPLDVPRDQFLVGGQAWRLCRAGLADADKFGIFDMHGLSFIRGDFIRDVASLNKMELLPWDCWGLAETRDEDLSAADLALLDQAAELTCGDVPEWELVRQLYESDERLRVPAVIRSYTQAGVQTVELIQRHAGGFVHLLGSDSTQ